MRIIVSSVKFADHLTRVLELGTGTEDNFIVAFVTAINDTAIKIIPITGPENTNWYECGAKIKEPGTSDITRKQLKAVRKLLRALPEQPVVIHFNQDERVKIADFVAEF